ncbi:DUF3563 domain-containing protein [Methylibium petroleiphilum]|uniref:DUF3563 domain-containing protein n=1 Tax=Methylibium petroleiphilum (strain ATCC BAA-1232 / LMG 22953 / PM1) TaxID=420662 RepID=A2SMU6_METPP|nr:DUF3563 domain-containing protein [Methylibium petroleiphilum]ABM96885.1 hypothetical protein Mpe_B0106 [Methylibium petroleiphilum PM1]
MPLKNAMSALLSFLKGLFQISLPTQRELDEAYLAGSVDMSDLERRMREIDGRGRSFHRNAPQFGLYVR